jgi:hypothetical protein
MPALNKARQQAWGTKCLTSQHQIGLALHMYADDYEDFVPRDADTVNWIIVFMPYLGTKWIKPNDYMEVEIYDCPSFPKFGMGENNVSNGEQTVDYVVNAWSFENPNQPNGQSTNGPTKRSLFTRPGTTVYLADNEAGVWRPVVRNHDDLTAMTHYRRLDVWHPSHLPGSNSVSTSNNNQRRVAQTRHRSEGCNNLFVDAHVEWLHCLNNDRYMWGGPR